MSREQEKTTSPSRRQEPEKRSGSKGLSSPNLSNLVNRLESKSAAEHAEILKAHDRALRTLRDALTASSKSAASSIDRDIQAQLGRLRKIAKTTESSIAQASDEVRKVLRKAWLLPLAVTLSASLTILTLLWGVGAWLAGDVVSLLDQRRHLQRQIADLEAMRLPITPVQGRGAYVRVVPGTPVDLTGLPGKWMPVDR